MSFVLGSTAKRHLGRQAVILFGTTYALAALALSTIPLSITPVAKLELSLGSRPADDTPALVSKIARSPATPAGPTGDAVTLAPGAFDNPRAVAVGLGGTVFVADTGNPADPSSGRIVQVDRDGMTTPLLNGILNFVGSDEEFGQAHLHGLSDIAEHDDALYIVLGEEAWISRPLLGPNRLVRRDAAGEIASVFDFGLFEQDHDPGRDGPESNATGVAVALDGTLWVDDAAGNWLARLDASGAVTAVITFPEVDGEDPVPTGIAVGPDGGAYVALFRCQSPTAGKGGIAKIKSDGGYEIVASGLSNPIDIAFDASGALYVLEFSVDYAPESGRLLRVIDQGHTDVVLDGLNYPTGLAIDDRGGMYITLISEPSGGEAGKGMLLYYRPAE